MNAIEKASFESMTARQIDRGVVRQPDSSAYYYNDQQPFARCCQVSSFKDSFSRVLSRQCEKVCGAGTETSLNVVQ